MRIPNSARFALILAFNQYKTSPDNDTYSRPDDIVQRLVLKTKPRRIVRDCDTGAIISVPAPKVAATETRSSKNNSTQRIMDATTLGRILKAAEDGARDSFTRNWLRYAYDDDCPRSIKMAVLNGLSRKFFDLETRSRRISMNWVAMERYRDLASIVMIQTKNNRAEPRETFSVADKVGFLGYKPEYKSHWHRSWQPHENDMVNILELADKIGLGPVAAVVKEINLDISLLETGT